MRTQTLFLIALIALSIAGCQQPAIDPSLFQTNEGTVFVFLAPDCPLSQNYTLTLKELRSRFSVPFYGVIAGKHFDKAEIDAFVKEYQIDFPVLTDPDLKLVQHFDATTTPEAFAVNSSGEILYRGAIDNWAVDLGQHRTVITEYYLADALTSIVNGQEVKLKQTRSVGCFIEG